MIVSDNNSTASPFNRVIVPYRDIGGGGGGGGGGDLTHLIVADPLGSLTPVELLTFRTTWRDIESTAENG